MPTPPRYVRGELGYRQIAGLLRTAIEGGDYEPGAQLESESELGTRYAVDRTVINRALLILRAEGLVRVERGRGTFVREMPVLRRHAIARQQIRGQGGARGAFQAEMEALGITARSEAEVARAAAPADIAGLLGIASGALALVRRRRMYANKVPVQLAASWLPLDIAEGTPLAEDDTGPGGIYSRLAELGHAPARFAETVRVRPAADAEARFLRLDAEQRVYDLRRVARDDGGRVIEVNDIVLPAHQWELVYEWQARLWDTGAN